MLFMEQEETNDGIKYKYKVVSYLIGISSMIESYFK